MFLKRTLAVATLLFFFTPLVQAQSVLRWQMDTVYHSVVGRLVHGSGGYQNPTYNRSIRIKDMYFAHQADSIFIVDTRFNDFDFVLPAQSFSGMYFRFKSPKIATTVYDTLITVCEYTNAPGTILYDKRPYVGITTTDSSSDSNRQCVYGHDCEFLEPINLGDTVRGHLCYEHEFIPMDTISITSVTFIGRDSASFHLSDSTFPKSAVSGLYASERISVPYYFTPDRQTGVKRYEAIAVAKMISSDGVLCHESDIPVQGLLIVPDHDSINVGLFSTDSLALHYAIDSTIYKHTIVFQNNSGNRIKIDAAYMKPGDCFGLDSYSPAFGTNIDTNGYFYANLHYRGDSTFAGQDCSDTLYVTVENSLTTLSFPISRGKQSQATVASIPALTINLSLVPNPSKGNLTIETGLERNALIEIFDILGHQIASHEGTSWTVNALPPGNTYIVRVSIGNTVLSKRLLVE